MLLDQHVERTILPCGIRVVSEYMPHTRAVSLGAWVPRGSRHEAPEALGATHFLEHLLFKGTVHSTAEQIAQAFDAVGGESNAATAKEHTHYYARVLGEDLPLALRYIMEMVAAPLLDASAYEMERGVILDELAMGMDDPNERVHDAFAAAVFTDHPLGRPVGGSQESVSNITLDAIHGHYQAGYTPDQVVVSAAGSVRHQELCELVQASVEQARTGLAAGAANPAWEAWAVQTPAPARPLPGLDAPALSPAESRETQKIAAPFEQVHIILGGQGLPAGHPQRTAATVFETALGGGMSSRLFQKVREERGLVYQTYAFSVGYRDCGQFGMYGACSPENAAEVSRIFAAELERIAAEELGEEELTRVRGQLRGSIILGMEDPGAHMTRLGIAEVILGKYVPIQVSLDRLEQVSSADVREVAANLAATCNTEIWLGEVND